MFSHGQIGHDLLSANENINTGSDSSGTFEG
jgi:hypothetical protein